MYKRKRSFSRKTSNAKKRQYGKRRNINKKKLRMPRCVRLKGPVPDCMQLKLKWEKKFAITAGLDTLNIYLNGVNYPYAFTYTPQYFDQYSVLFNRYVVHSSSIHVTYVNENTIGGQMVVLPRTGATNLLSMHDAKERPYAKTRIMGVTGSGNSIGRIKHYMSVKKLTGRKILHEDETSLMLSNPVTASWWTIGTDTIREGTGGAVQNCQVFVKVTYYITMYDRKINV